ncbi:MAG: sensory box histidine kinase/response regulator [Bryobacterales bacterium]|nr:sensory box histidine kinase/response regulator [Bryobacterales bacterium]
MANQSTKNATILVLNSEPVVRSVIRDILEREGYVVLATGDLGTAVDIMSDCTPDLLLTNIDFPTSGHDAAQYLKKRCPKMRVLIMAGLPDDQRIEDRTAGAGFEVFPKPFSVAELTGKIREILAPVGRGAA